MGLAFPQAGGSVLEAEGSPPWHGRAPPGKPLRGGHPTTCSHRRTSCRCLAHPDSAPCPSLTEQARGGVLLPKHLPRLRFHSPSLCLWETVGDSCQSRCTGFSSSSSS